MSEKEAKQEALRIVSKYWDLSVEPKEIRRSATRNSLLEVQSNIDLLDKIQSYDYISAEKIV